MLSRESPGYPRRVRTDSKAVCVFTRINRLLTATFVVIGSVGVWLAVRGIFVAGIGWDMGIDATAAIEVRQLDLGMSLQEAYDSVYFTSEWYGVLIQTLADWLHQTTTGATGYLMPDIHETYQWQAGVTVAVAVAATGGLALAIGRVLRSAVAGSFVWALVWTVPLFQGMAHVDFKDIPVAAGLSAFSAGAALVLQKNSKAIDAIAAFVLASFGVMVALGTRITAWPLLAVTALAALLVAAAWFGRRRDLRSFGQVGLVLGGGIAAGLFLVWLMNPLARIDMPTWLWDSAVMARDTAGYSGMVRTAGTDLWSRELPWWYIPAWLGAQLPLLTAVFLLVGLGAVGWYFWRPSVRVGRDQVVALSPFVVQAIALPMLIVLGGSTIYDGLRHVLFMVPALVALASLPVVAAQANAMGGGNLGRVVLVLALLAPALGLFNIVRWSPYSYAYVNPAAGADRHARDWELDYWGVTAIEGVERLQELGMELVAVSPTDFTSKMVGGLTPNAVNAQHPREFGYYQFIRGAYDELPPGCRSVFAIERDGHLLGEGAICER